jgi:putative oxidoreductase
MKIVSIILRILFGLVLLLPVLGTLGVFPPPTAEMYSPPGWAFMQAMTATGYLPLLIALTCAVCLVLVIMNRTALAAVLVAPLTVNILLFHLVLDRSMFTPSALPAWVLLITNACFLWENRVKYRSLW